MGPRRSGHDDLAGTFGILCDRPTHILLDDPGRLTQKGRAMENRNTVSQGLCSRDDNATRGARVFVRGQVPRCAVRCADCASHTAILLCLLGLLRCMA